MAGLLALLRALHDLYQSPGTRPAYNVLAVVTSGGAAGHAGLKQWLADADPASIDNVVFALSLDTIGRSSSGKLFLHTAAGSNAAGAEGQKAVHEAAQSLGVTLEDVETPSGDGSAPVWASQVLAQKGIPAAALSALAVAPALGVVSSSSSSDGEVVSLQQQALEGLRVGSLGDNADGADVQLLLEAVQVAGESVVKLLYPGLQQGLKLVDIMGTAAANGPLVQSWLNLFTRSPRMHPLDHVSEEGAAMHKALRGFLKEHSSMFKRHMWHLETAPKLAGMQVKDTGTAKLQMYFSAGTMLDMMLLGGVIVYLSALYALLRIGTQGWNEFTKIWRSSEAPSRGRGGKYR